LSRAQSLKTSVQRHEGFKGIGNWGYTIRGSNFGRSRRFSPFPKYPDRLWGEPSLQFNGHRDFPRAVKCSGRNVDISPKSTTEVKKKWAVSSIPSISLQGVNRKKTYLYL
jgi:hypothetical protein